jgi:tetratricopeptide (TPR) repeat protein
MSQTLGFHPLAERAREALRTHHFASARQILEAKVNDPDFICEFLICEIMFGNEELAAKRYSEAKSGQRFEELTRLLNEYFYCRQQMAIHLETEDALAKSWLKKHPYQPAKGVGITVSACLIVKDEEATLPATLDSLQGVVDEIVVVDTGSTDRTIEIAKSYGAVIGHFKWISDFSAARNEALKLGTGDWALWIDADETLDPTCKEAFQKAVVRPHMGGYSIQIINYLDEGGTTTEFVHTPTRLFRRLPGIEFTEPIHEQITPSLMKLGLPWTPLENCKIHHEGYRQAALVSKDKVKRTLTMLEKVVQTTPNDPFQLFNLANTYFVGAEYDKAVQAAERSVTNLPAAGAEYGPAVYQVLATSYDVLGKHEIALKTCKKCADTPYHSLVNEYLRATALLNLGRFKEALTSVETSLTMTWPLGMLGDKGIADFRRHGLKGQILGCLERWEEALEWFNVALEKQPDFPASYMGRAMALHNLKRYDEAVLDYEKARKEHRQIPMIEKGLGVIEEELGNLNKAIGHYQLAWQARPSDMSLWSLWVDALQQIEDHAGVSRAFEALAAVNKVTPEILVNWAFALEKVGDTEKALACLQDALQMDSEDPNILFTTGDILYRLGRFADAALLYEKAVRMNINFAEGWFVLGNALAQIGHDGGAIRCYEQALVIDPRHEKCAANIQTLKAA